MYAPRMQSAVLLAHLRRELDAFALCLRSGELSAPVVHCGAWTLFDLAEHLGRSNEWVTVAVNECRGDHQAPAAPREQDALATWFDDTCARMLEALEQDPSRRAWTIYPPHTIGFWRRRRCLETLVHRWDAQNALGIGRDMHGNGRGAMDPLLAAEGVAEVIDTIAPRQIELGRAKGPNHALRLLATDTGACWVFGPGAPVATISATAQNLLLAMWNRLPSNDPAIRWGGDREAGQAVLAGSLVP